MGNNNGHKKILIWNDNAILWSKETKRPVQTVKLSDQTPGSPVNLFTPEISISKVNLFGNTLVYILGNSQVGMYNLATKKNKIVYYGTSLWDAVLTDEKTLYVARSVANSSETPLVWVNLGAGGETLPVTVAGSEFYSLAFNPNGGNRNKIYGMVIASEAGGINRTFTKLIEFDTDTKETTVFLKIEAQDSTAWNVLNDKYILTNLGQKSISFYNLETKRNLSYERSVSIPEYVAATTSKVAILNKDGSISWYDPENTKPLASWYLTPQAEWLKQ